MTHALRYTQHALDRMKERTISDADVRFVLKYGTPEPAPTWKGKVQRWMKREFIRSHEVKVVYFETPSFTEIITVMWVYEETAK